ncbi:hypothetical protein [Streptomyces sp. LN549]|uniref:hypothetical protein n=1 Tax=Streptomyces sp. LN549 TaxID=3112979 RepID=UPI00371C37DE
MKRNERARQVLSRFGDVAWFRSPVERHPVNGYLQVAFVGWRYTEPREELKTVFDSAVREAPKQVEWTFGSARNWMIVPTRLIQEAGADNQTSTKQWTRFESVIRNSVQRRLKILRGSFGHC